MCCLLTAGLHFVFLFYIIRCLKIGFILFIIVSSCSAHWLTQSCHSTNVWWMKNPELIYSLDLFIRLVWGMLHQQCVDYVPYWYWQHDQNFLSTLYSIEERHWYASNLFEFWKWSSRIPPKYWMKKLYMAQEINVFFDINHEIFQNKNIIFQLWAVFPTLFPTRDHIFLLAHIIFLECSAVRKRSATSC